MLTTANSNEHGASKAKTDDFFNPSDEPLREGEMAERVYPPSAYKTDDALERKVASVLFVNFNLAVTYSQHNPNLPQSALEMPVPGQDLSNGIIDTVPAEAHKPDEAEPQGELQAPFEATATPAALAAQNEDDEDGAGEDDGGAAASSTGGIAPSGKTKMREKVIDVAGERDLIVARVRDKKSWPALVKALQRQINMVSRKKGKGGKALVVVPNQQVMQQLMDTNAGLLSAAEAKGIYVVSPDGVSRTVAALFQEEDKPYSDKLDAAQFAARRAAAEEQVVQNILRPAEHGDAAFYNADRVVLRFR